MGSNCSRFCWRRCARGSLPRRTNPHSIAVASRAQHEAICNTRIALKSDLSLGQLAKAIADLASYYFRLPDAELLAAYAEGEKAYRADAWTLINNELIRRGLEASEGGELVESEIFHPGADNSLVARALMPGAPAANETFPDEIKIDSTAQIQAAKRQRRRGIIWLGLGAAMTALSYREAGSQGTYYLYYGAMLIGVFNFVLGNTRVERARGIYPFTGKPAINL